MNSTKQDWFFKTIRYYLLERIIFALGLFNEFRHSLKKH